MKKKPNWNDEKKAEFLTRIGGLLEQGYSLSESIEFFLKYENKKMKPVLLVILQQLQMGMSFSATLVELQMPKNIISFVYFAEHYGDLANGLLEAGTILKKTEESKRKLQKVLKYPIFLFWTLTVFTVILYQFVFPQFTLLFSNIELQLPFITRVFLSFIESLPNFFVLSFILIAVLLAFIHFLFRTKSESYRVKWFSRLPVFGRFYRMLATYYFSMNLSCLMKSGMSMYDALITFCHQDRKRSIGLEAKQMIATLEKGESLQDALFNDTIFLKELAYIVEHGQANGRLVEELEHYSKWLLNDFDEKVKKIFMFIQPTLFLFIGIIVLLMFASILLPIFTVIDGI